MLGVEKAAIPFFVDDCTLSSFMHWRLFFLHLRLMRSRLYLNDGTTS